MLLNITSVPRTFFTENKGIYIQILLESVLVSFIKFLDTETRLFVKLLYMQLASQPHADNFEQHSK